MRPLGDRIIVQRIDTGEKETKGGLLIPDQAQELGDCAQVVSVGPGKWDDGERVAVSLAAGDKIVINRYAGTEIKYDGDDMLILREDDVLATIS
jgi:chaperonin GroES